MGDSYVFCATSIQAQAGCTTYLPSCLPPPPCSVRVRNLYFEPTPLSLLAAVVTEEGRLEPAAIAAAVQERKQQYRTAFQLP